MAPSRKVRAYAPGGVPNPQGSGFHDFKNLTNRIRGKAGVAAFFGKHENGGLLHARRLSRLLKAAGRAVAGVPGLFTLKRKKKT